VVRYTFSHWGGLEDRCSRSTRIGLKGRLVLGVPLVTLQLDCVSLTISIYLRIVGRCGENPVNWSHLKQPYACAPPNCAVAARSNSTATKSPNVSVTRIVTVFLLLTERYTVLWPGLKRWACSTVTGKTRRFLLAKIVRVAAYMF